MTERRFVPSKQTGAEINFDPGLELAEDGTVIVVAEGGRRFNLTEALVRLSEEDTGQKTISGPFEGAPANTLYGKTVGPMPKDGRIDYVAYIPLGDVSLDDAPFEGRGWRLVRVGDNATIFDSVYHHANRPFEDQEQMPRDFLYGFYPNEDVRNDMRAGDIIRFESYRASFYYQQPPSTDFPIWLFDSATSAGDPGTAKVRINGAGTAVYISNTDFMEADQSAYLDSLDEAVGFKGHLRLFGRNRSDYKIYEVVSVVATSSAHKTITVVLVLANGSFDNGEPLGFDFDVDGLYADNPEAPLDPGGILTIAYTPLVPPAIAGEVPGFGMVRIVEDDELAASIVLQPGEEMLRASPPGLEADVFDPGGGGGGSAAYCFKLFDLKWGKDFAAVYNWQELKRMLVERGISPHDWACEHRVWAQCLDHVENCAGVAPAPPPLQINGTVGLPQLIVRGGALFLGAAASQIAANNEIDYASIHLAIYGGGGISGRQFEEYLNPGSSTINVPEWHREKVEFAEPPGVKVAGEPLIKHHVTARLLVRDIYGQTRVQDLVATRAIDRIRKRQFPQCGFLTCSNIASSLIGGPYIPFNHLFGEGIFKLFRNSPSDRIHSANITLQILGVGYPIPRHTFVWTPGPLAGRSWGFLRCVIGIEHLALQSGEPVLGTTESPAMLLGTAEVWVTSGGSPYKCPTVSDRTPLTEIDAGGDTRRFIPSRGVTFIDSEPRAF